jgi:hypothetical protein
MNLLQGSAQSLPSRPGGGCARLTRCTQVLQNTCDRQKAMRTRVDHGVRADNKTAPCEPSIKLTLHRCSSLEDISQGGGGWDARDRLSESEQPLIPDKDQRHGCIPCIRPDAKSSPALVSHRSADDLGKRPERISLRL